jgi:hypothetical protein
MDYEKVKEYLTSIGAELLPESEFAERWRVIMGSEPYMSPYGCLSCGEAEGKKDFTDVLFVIYPDELPDERGRAINSQLLGIGGPAGLSFTSIARCKFCGQCDIYPDY